MAASRLRENRSFLTAAKNLLALFAIVVVVMGGLIYSYTEIIPLFTRSGKISPADIAVFSTPPETFFSFFLPLPFTQTGEEISMNNNYIGLLVIVSAIAGIFINRKPASLFLPATSLFFLLLSTNFPISLWLIQKLPFLQYVRLNGELRIFGMLPLLLFGAIQFDSLFTHQRKYLRNTCLVISGLLMITCISAAIPLSRCHININRRYFMVASSCKNRITERNHSQPGLRGNDNTAVFYTVGLTATDGVMLHEKRTMADLAGGH